MLILNQLQEPLPGMPGCFARALTHTRQTAFQKLIRIVWLSDIMKRQEMQREFAKKLHRDLLERQEVVVLLEQGALAKLVRDLTDKGIDELRPKLRADEPLVRLITIQTISARRLPLQPELIDCLNDPVPTIRQTARQALIHLSRGTDFGPLPKDGKTRRQRSIEKWRHWLALQNPTTLPINGPALKVVLDPADPAAEAEEAEVVRLRDELVKAPADKQAEVLQRLKTATGDLQTDALAQAIPQLSELMRGKARDALTERLARLPAKSLRERLTDEDAEVRQAAACACGRTKARDHIPDLIPLLAAPEVAVAEAAHSALKKLTGQDFGPKPGLPLSERTCATSAWTEWWQKHQHVKK